jgi:hypothetical protein
VGPSETVVLHRFSVFLTQENKKVPVLNLGPKLAIITFSSNLSPLFPDICAGYMLRNNRINKESVTWCTG